MPRTPIFFNLKSNILLLTMSNDFFKSIKFILPTLLLLKQLLICDLRLNITCDVLFPSLNSD